MNQSRQFLGQKRPSSAASPLLQPTRQFASLPAHVPVPVPLSTPEQAQNHLEHARRFGWSLEHIPVDRPERMAIEENQIGSVSLKRTVPKFIPGSMDERLAVASTRGHMLQTKAVTSAVRKDNITGLPDQLKARVEALSGLSLDDVHVHYNSSQPAGVQALAYTQGTEIHVAPGQEEHLSHETWHVVQQMQGRVRQTIQLQGVAVNDDSILEHEADAIASTLKQAKPGLQMMRAGESNSSLAQRTARGTLPKHVVPSPTVIQRTKWQSDGKTWKVVSTSTDDTDEFEDPNQPEAGMNPHDFEGMIYDQSTSELRHAGETIEEAEELQAFTGTILQQLINTGENPKLTIGQDVFGFVYKTGNITVKANKRQNAYRSILAQILVEVDSHPQTFANLLLNASYNLPSVSGPVRELLVLTNTTEFERDSRIPGLFKNYLEELSNSKEKTLNAEDVIKACPWMETMNKFRAKYGKDPNKASSLEASSKLKGRKPKKRKPVEKQQASRNLKPIEQIAVAILDFGMRAKGALKGFEAISTRGQENREKIETHLQQILLKHIKKLYDVFQTSRGKGLDLTKLGPLDKLLKQEVAKVNKLLEKKGLKLRIFAKGLSTKLEIK